MLYLCLPPVCNCCGVFFWLEFSLHHGVIVSVMWGLVSINWVSPSSVLVLFMCQASVSPFEFWYFYSLMCYFDLYQWIQSLIWGQISLYLEPYVSCVICFL